MKRTVAKNHRGDVLLTVNDRLDQVREGRDFYVGQKRYVVSGIDSEEDGTLVVKLTDPDANCGYKSHHQPCECDGMGGDR